MLTPASLLAHSRQLIPRNPPWLWDGGGLLRTDYVTQMSRDQNIHTEATNGEAEAFQGKQISCPNVYIFCSRKQVWRASCGLLYWDRRKTAAVRANLSSGAFWCLFLASSKHLIVLTLSFLLTTQERAWEDMSLLILLCPFFLLLFICPINFLIPKLSFHFMSYSWDLNIHSSIHSFNKYLLNT